MRLGVLGGVLCLSACDETATDLTLWCQTDWTVASTICTPMALALDGDTAEAIEAVEALEGQPQQPISAVRNHNGHVQRGRVYGSGGDTDVIP